MQRFLYIIFFVLAVHLAYGADKPPLAKKPVVTVHPVLKTDTSSAISVHHFDAGALKAYSNRPEFQYQEKPEGISWWTRFWRWFWYQLALFWNWLIHLLHITPPKGQTVSIWYYILKYTFIVLGVAAIAFLALKLAGVDMANIFRKKSAAVPIPYSEFFEDINQINFDDEIENAVAKNNYRFAVRLLYLKCLKQLSDAGMIEWQIDKTNSIYINELKNEEQRSAFKQLTRQFEYVWYGEFLIDAPVYQNISLSFTDFNKRVA